VFEFTWLSFGYAVVNFLILAALLWKFLHKPLLSVLAKRRASIEESEKKAADAVSEAERLKGEYEGKLAEAAAERDRVLSEARQSAEEARQKVVERAKEDAAREVSDLKKAFERERDEALKTLQKDIADAGINVAETVLRKTVDRDVEAGLHAGLLQSLDDMAPAQEGELPVRVTSARELAAPDKEQIVERIQRVAGASAEIEFITDAALIAGVRVEFSAASVDASLADLPARVRETVSTATAVEDGES
jgi:F-type H+-transporting ATPase subunit b